jgi:hypothetical protein
MLPSLTVQAVDPSTQSHFKIRGAFCEFAVRVKFAPPRAAIQARAATPMALAHSYSPFFNIRFATKHTAFAKFPPSRAHSQS